jgi:hypothetical protein
MAHPDLDSLMNSLLIFAEQMLKEEGEFLPFAGAMDMDGEIYWIGADNGQEYPGSQALIDILTTQLHSEAVAGKIRASGICLDTRFRESSSANAVDAVCFRLERVSGEGIVVYIPYSIIKPGTLTFGVKTASPFIQEVFSSRS